jgi:replicative DNA helicase
MKATIETRSAQLHAIDAEEAVLGAVLIQSEAFASVQDVLTTDDFCKPAHKLIWKAVVEVASKGDPIDLITVVNQLKVAGNLEAAGSPHEVSRLTNNIASAANIEAHAQLIREFSIRRMQLGLALDLTRKIHEEGADAWQANDFISQRADAIFSRLSSNRSETIADQLKAAFERIDRAGKSDGLTGLSTGIKALDEIHRGRQNGELTIMAGRPSMGKSAKALEEAIHIALKGGKVLYFSLEMSSLDLTDRALSSISGIPLIQIKTCNLSDNDWELLHNARTRLAAAGIRIVDSEQTLDGIRAMARKLKHRGEVDVVYIDYLQIVSHQLNSGNRENEVSSISRALKQLARVLNVPVVALSQLNRSVEHRNDKKPMLSDLRDSGSLEQDADVVEFIWRPEYYSIRNIEDYPDTHQLAFTIIAKNRNGMLADVPMKFRGELTKFTEWDD